MIRLQKVARNYGVHEVLKGVDWSIPVQVRVGLVGPNGAGKTTLLRLIAGLEEPDEGQVDVPRHLALGYLPQEGARLPEGTLLDALLEPFAEVAALEKELERLHHEMATATGERLESLTRLSGDVQHRFEVAGGFDLEIRAKIILGGLGFAPEDHARPLREFSGGYRMRAALGALLLRRPDYLLLDEPTNHLDLEAIGWLESFLSDSPSALIIVSHDRTFLNRLAGSIAEVDSGRVRVWAGNYDRFRLQKEEARELAAKKAAQEAHRVDEIERFIERFRYKATKARQVQSRIKMLEKMERTETMSEEFSWRFNFPAVARSGQRVAILTGIRKAYGANRVLDGVDLEIHRGDRIALVGPNGCGKSTLLQIIAGRLGPDGGTLELGEKVILHYFAQHVLESLTPGRTVLEEMQAWAPSKTVGQLRSLLGIFQFSGVEVFKKVEVLSGGEKNRLALARLTLDPGNFLLLDEPTNHLDLPTREALEEALAGFSGTLLFVSHDRYFINKVATRVAAFQAGRLLLTRGGYDDYLAASQVPAAVPPSARARAAATGSASTAPSRGASKAPSSAPPAREQRRLDAEARNRRGRELKIYRDRIVRLEEKILPHETRLKEIESLLSAGETYKEPGVARALGEEKKSIEIELAHLYDEWDEATSDLQREDSRSS
ncbi:MAG TPA: ABC-F family ATP-binding cassette domain-containing protein [Candidatus Polarisedimenticolia bacterium]|jgi:ATP-binding cassette subfamily F protein 3|nr:ABC-F family ATP-binding cassette domain-containing protein [Candidatus Polarisedimenticolia bacterium]